MNRNAFFAFLLLTALTISWPQAVMAQSGSSARPPQTKPQVDQAAQDDGWIDVRPGGIAGNLRMPIEPRHIQRTMSPTEDTEITLDTYMSTVRDGNLSYVISHFEMLDTPIGKKARTTRYDEAVHGQMARVGGEIDSYSKVELQGQEGRDFVYRFSDEKGNKFKTHARIFMRLGAMYELKVVAIEEHFSEQGAAKFFESFRFQREKNPLPAEEPAEESGQ